MLKTSSHYYWVALQESTLEPLGFQTPSAYYLCTAKADFRATGPPDVPRTTFVLQESTFEPRELRMSKVPFATTVSRLTNPDGQKRRQSRKSRTRHTSKSDYSYEDGDVDAHGAQAGAAQNAGIHACHVFRTRSDASLKQCTGPDGEHGFQPQASQNVHGAEARARLEFAMFHRPPLESVCEALLLDLPRRTDCIAELHIHFLTPTLRSRTGGIRLGWEHRTNCLNHILDFKFLCMGKPLQSTCRAQSSRRVFLVL